MAGSLRLIRFQLSAPVVAHALSLPASRLALALALLRWTFSSLTHHPRLGIEDKDP